MRDQKSSVWGTVLSACLFAITAGLNGCGAVQQAATAVGQGVVAGGQGVVTGLVTAGNSNNNANVRAGADQQANVNLASFVPPVDNGSATVSSTATQHSIWPVDTAIVPLPSIVLATDDTVDLSARLPRSRAQDVVLDPVGENRFTVKVPQITSIGVTQQGPTLCWAACTQTLLRQQRIQVDQKALAQQFVPDTDEDDDQTAGIGIVTRALNPDLEAQVEQRGAIPISLLPITSDQMLGELMAGNLCIAGLVEDHEANIGHACVICGATFARLKPSATAGLHAIFSVNKNAETMEDESTQSMLNPVYGLYEVQLFDPEPNVGIRRLSAQEFCDQAAFITSHQIARNILLDALKAPDSVGMFAGQVVVKSKNRDRAKAAMARLKMNIKPRPVKKQLKIPSRPSDKSGVKTKSDASTDKKKKNDKTKDNSQ